MSNLENDPSWRDAARNVARELDRNHPEQAQELMRRDLWQLQNDPRAQHEFINMVNRMDHKGHGLDLHISRGPNGQETWQIAPPNYGYNDGRYPVPVPPPQGRPDVVIVQPERPSPGERFVDGVVQGVGMGVGIRIIDEITGGRRHHRR